MNELLNNYVNVDVNVEWSSPFVIVLLIYNNNLRLHGYYNPPLSIEILIFFYFIFIFISKTDSIRVNRSIRILI